MLILSAKPYATYGIYEHLIIWSFTLFGLYDYLVQNMTPVRAPLPTTRLTVMHDVGHKIIRRVLVLGPHFWGQQLSKVNVPEKKINQIYARLPQNTHAHTYSFYSEASYHGKAKNKTKSDTCSKFHGGDRNHSVCKSDFVTSYPLFD
jgi:hypothetical protein